MSKRVVISKDNIAAAGVRVGDVIRVQLTPGNPLGWFDPHEVVSVDVRITSADWYERIGRLGNAIALLSRELTVPTEPYSVVAPPDHLRSDYSPYILEYDRGTLVWTRANTVESEAAVLEALQNGWRPVELLNATVAEEVVTDEF